MNQTITSFGTILLSCLTLAKFWLILFYSQTGAQWRRFPPPSYGHTLLPRRGRAAADPSPSPATKEAGGSTGKSPGCWSHSSSLYRGSVAVRSEPGFPWGIWVDGCGRRAWVVHCHCLVFVEMSLRTVSLFASLFTFFLGPSAASMLTEHRCCPPCNIQHNIVMHERMLANWTSVLVLATLHCLVWALRIWIPGICMFWTCLMSEYDMLSACIICVHAVWYGSRFIRPGLYAPWFRCRVQSISCMSDAYNFSYWV